GSVPDGWWKDRAAAAGRLRDRLAGLAAPADDLGLDATTWFPQVSLVVEGQARSLADDDEIVVVRADAGGDDAIVDEAVRLTSLGRAVTVVTSDRALQSRAEAAGARILSARALLNTIGR
ncbi:NYN domain-containing protein, partial [Devosia sp. ZW T5_3]